MDVGNIWGKDFYDSIPSSDSRDHLFLVVAINLIFSVTFVVHSKSKDDKQEKEEQKNRPFATLSL